MGKVINIVSRPSRARAAAGQAVLDFIQDDPQWAAENPAASSALRASAQRAIDTGQGGHGFKGRYCMVSTEHIPMAVVGIRRLSPDFRPSTATAVFTICLGHMEWDTGRITASPDQLAELLGTARHHVVSAMKGLVALRILREETALIPRAGKKPKAQPVFFFNPSISWLGRSGPHQEEIARGDPGHSLTVARDGKGHAYLAVVKG